MYYVKKLALLLLSVLLLSAAVFFLSRLAPADPLRAYYGERADKMTPQEKEQTRQRLGLNDPLPRQYVRWLREALRGNFGISYQYKQDVKQVVAARAGNTLLLGGTAFVLLSLLSLLLGMLCVSREDSLGDRILCRLGTVASCIPEFWLSLVLILVFSVTLRLLPTGGAYTPGREAEAGDRIAHLILPLAVVLLSHLWNYAYLVRNRLAQEVRKPYVLHLRAMGMKPGQVLLRHCLRNSMGSYLGILAVSIPHILGGTYIVEAVFSYPGLGTLAYDSARCGDYNLLMLLCLLTGTAVMLCSILARVAQEKLDPRLRERQGQEAA